MNLFLNEINKSDIKIYRTKNNTFVSYNGFSLPNEMNAHYTNLRHSFDSSLYNDNKDAHDIPFMMARIAKSEMSSLENYFTTYKDYTIHKLMQITDSDSGYVEFANLEEEIQAKISKFAEWHKYNVETFLSLLLDEEQEDLPPFNYSTSFDATHFVCNRLAEMEIGYFTNPDGSKITKQANFIDSYCDRLNIPRIKNLKNVIYNVKHKSKPGETFDIIKDRFVHILDEQLEEENNKKKVKKR